MHSFFRKKKTQDSFMPTFVVVLLQRLVRRLVLLVIYIFVELEKCIVIRVLTSLVRHCVSECAYDTIHHHNLSSKFVS